MRARTLWSAPRWTRRSPSCSAGRGPTLRGSLRDGWWRGRCGRRTFLLRELAALAEAAAHAGWPADVPADVAGRLAALPQLAARHRPAVGRITDLEVEDPYQQAMDVHQRAVDAIIDAVDRLVTAVAE